MATIANLVVEIGGNSSKLISETEKAKKGIKSIESVANDAANAIKTAFAVIGVGALSSMGREAINTADQMGKLAQRLGSTSEALSELAFVADRGGVSFNTMQMGLQRATRRIAEAANGTGEAVKALKELNLSAEELNKLAPEDQFEAIAESISKLESNSDRVRLAMKLFDSEGVALIQTMQGGSEEIRNLREEARQLGATISSDAAASAAAFNDKMTILQFRMQGFVNRAAIPAAEAFLDIAEAINESGSRIEDSLQPFEGVKTAVKGIATTAIAANGVLTSMGEVLVGLSFTANEIAQGNFSRAMTEWDETNRRSVGTFDLMKKRIEDLWKTTEAFSKQTAPGGTIDFNNLGLTGSGENVPSGESPEKTEGEQLDTRMEKTRAFLEKKIGLIDESFMSEQALMAQRFEENLEIVDRHETDKLTRLSGYTDKLLKMAGDDQAKWNDVLRFDAKIKEKIEEDSHKRRVGLAKKYGMNLLSDAAQYSKAAFNINKAAALAEGAIKAKESVLGAYAFGAKVGGPVLGAAFAATAAVVAFGQLRAIADSSFSGGDSGGGISSGGGAASAVSGGETPIETGSANDEPLNKTVFINVEGIDDEAFLTKNQVRSIVDQINEERDANVRIVI